MQKALSKTQAMKTSTYSHLPESAATCLAGRRELKRL